MTEKRQEQQMINRIFKDKDSYKDFCRRWAIVSMMIDRRRSNPNLGFMAKMEGIKIE